MQLYQTSMRSMIQSPTSSKDIVHIAFSHSGTLMLTVDKTQSMKLWNVLNQTQLHTFSQTQAKAHYALFTPDDQRIITIGNQVIKVFNVSSLEEVKKFEGGIKMGTGDCSKDNLLFVYSNASKLQMRELSGFQKVEFLDDKQEETNPCLPYFVKFSKTQSSFFTSSLITGVVCKWSLSQTVPYKTTYTLVSQLTINRTLSGLSLFDNHILISTDKNPSRPLYLLNTSSSKNLSLFQSSSLPKTSLFDFNQQTHSITSLLQNLILSIVVSGNYLYYHRASDLKLLMAQKLKMNTYALQFDEQMGRLAIGGQVFHRENNTIFDQVVFFEVKMPCQDVINAKQGNQTKTINRICKCKDGFGWDWQSQSCKQLPCSTMNPTNPNQCKCPQQPQSNTTLLSNPNYYWNPFYFRCQLSCQTFTNSFLVPYQISTLSQCPCKSSYFWNPILFQCQSLICTQLQGSTGTVNTTLNLKTCNCLPKFDFAQQTSLCILNCSKIQHSNPQKQSQFVKINQQKCECETGYQWVQDNYQCAQTINQEPFTLQQQKGQVPVLAIVLPVILGLVCCVVLVCLIWIFWWRRRRVSQQEDYEYQTDQNQAQHRIQNADQLKTTSSQNQSDDVKLNRRRKHKKNHKKQAPQSTKSKQQDLNIAINNEILRNYQSSTVLEQAGIKSSNQHNQDIGKNSAVQKVKQHNDNQQQYQENRKPDQKKDKDHMIEEIEMEMQSDRKFIPKSKEQHLDPPLEDKLEVESKTNDKGDHADLEEQFQSNKSVTEG